METQDISDWADPSTEIQSTFSPVQWYEVFPMTMNKVTAISILLYYIQVHAN